MYTSGILATNFTMLLSPWKQDWGSVVLLLCVWGCGVGVGGAGDGGRPNVVFVMADDLGWNDVAWHNPRMQSPFLHHLSHHHGIILNQSYVNVACSPFPPCTVWCSVFSTRSAFLSGHYPYHLGTQQGVFSPCEPTGVPTKFKFFPEILQTMGYSTYIVGKWHLGYCKKDYLPTYRGFDRFYGLYLGQQDHFKHTLAEEGYYGLDLWNGSKPDFQKTGVYSTHLFSSKAIEMIKTHKETKTNPFFLYMAFTNVHAVLQAPKNYTTECPQRNRKRRIYCGMLRAMDEAVGRIVDALKQTGIYNNTVIIFSTDNGGQTMEGGNNYPLRGNKLTMWEGGTRAISFLHSPLFPPLAQTRKQLFHIVDWFPTILSLTGKPTPKYGDGINQWDMITNNTKGKRLTLVYKIHKKNSAIRYKQFKFIKGDPGSPSGWIKPDGIYSELDWIPPAEEKIHHSSGLRKPQIRLFNLRLDPTEHFNVARKYPRVVAEMKRVLARLREGYVRSIHRHSDRRGDPSHFNGTYATGWCDANNVED